VLSAALNRASRAASTSETSVNVCQTTRRNIPEDSHLHIRRRENLKSHVHYRVQISRPLDIISQMNPYTVFIFYQFCYYPPRYGKFKTYWNRIRFLLDLKYFEELVK
jgi:transposase-like protein